MMKKNYSDEDIRMITDTASQLKNSRSLFYTGHCTGIVPYEVMKTIMCDQLIYLHCGDQAVI